MMPVKGGRAQKRVNERSRNHNLDNSNLGQLSRRHHGLPDSFLHMEDLEEIEALFEVEQLRLLQQQQQHVNDRPDVNILRSPDRSLHPFLERAPPPRLHSATRTLPRTPHAAAAAAVSTSVPLAQLSSIILNMTFSDAEDEHHGTGGNNSQDRDRTPSRSRTESGVSNASTASLASPTSSHLPANNGQATEESASPQASPAAASNATVSNAVASNAAASNVGAPNAAAAIPGASNVDIANAVNSLSGIDMKGVDSKRILEKLQQVQGYIQQTTTAMAALEQQGDIGTQSDIYTRFTTLNKSLQHQEGEYLDILARSLVLNKAAATAAQVTNGSHSTTTTSTIPQVVNGQMDTTETSSDGHVVGVVGTGSVRSLQDRLAASQVESVALMTQMRNSIARREDLMTRYKATRERLANLKQQRLGIQQEKQQLLDSARQVEEEEPIEDTIPGAANWSLEEITQALVDFQGLLEKVERLTDIYSQKAQVTDPDDAAEQANVNSKLGQLAVKRRQLTDALTRLRVFKLQKQPESGQQQGDAGEGESGSQTSSTTPGQTPDTSQPSQQVPRTTEAGRSVGVGAMSGAPAISNLENETVTMSNIGSATRSLTSATDDLQTRQTQLVSLQQQLSDMKQLLDVTTSAQREAESRAQESKRRLDEAKAAHQATLSEEAEEGARARGGDAVVEMSGRKITLTEEERRNPEINSKYQQLAQAKDRLAKMEEVIEMITAAKRNGQNLREVMPADYLAILEEAEDEMAVPASAPRCSRPAPEQPTPDQDEEDDDTRVSRRHSRTPRTGSVGHGERERERCVREQERSEISAMQKRLNKSTPRILAINDGSRHGHEKGAIKKQPQALWQEGSHNNNSGGINRGAAVAGGLDPRVSEVLAMQEELRQKKNALEALMRRMGKSSSLNADNISDNISEGSERLREQEDEVVGGMGATWGGSGPHDYSDDQLHQTSDDELIEEEDENSDLLTRGPLRRQHQPPQQMPQQAQPKDRNRHSASRHRRGRFSVNNLSASNYGSTGRTKHNRLRASSAPKALWEPVESNYKSPSNTSMQAHHSLNTALSQLTQVQGTINNLQESLRHEQSQMMGSGGGHYPSFTAPPPLLLSATDLPTPTPTAPLAYLPGQALTPMSSYAGLGSLAMAGQGSGGGEGGREMSHQVLSGLQQCFSQLHLHSLEIQALSKHLQLLERRDQGGGSALIADAGGGGVGIRVGGRVGARRSEEEEEEDDDNEEEDDDNDEEEEDDLTPSRPPYPLHQNLLAASRAHPGKEGTRGIPRGPSYPMYPRQPSDGVEGQAMGAGVGGGVGVINPIYGHLGDVQDQTGGTWGSLAPTPGSEQPSDQLASLMGGGVPSGVAVGGVRGMESSPSHPLLHLDRLGDRGQTQQQHHEDHHHWASIPSSHHPLHHQTTDLLNNQVPPGTRANNYWDNFRSYSRQNLLSSTTKSNTADHHHHLLLSGSVTSATSAPTHGLPASSSTGHLHLPRESSRVEDKRFNVSINNSGGGMGLGPGGGARARVPEPHINNPRPPSGNPRVRNPVSPSHHPHGQNKHKANNRNKQGGMWPQESNMADRNPPQSGVPYPRDRSHVNYNYNYPRINSSDSDGVTLDVVREAEALMARHASQPEFLVQLFRHAAQITVHTDQHVAVALLQDLACQPHRPDHGVNANRRSSSSLNDNTSLSLPAPLRDSWRPQPSHLQPRNALPQENASVVGGSGSGSEVSDSGLTSEDEDSRALYRNVKNLSLSPGGQGGGGSGSMVVGGGGGMVGDGIGGRTVPRSPTVSGINTAASHQFPYLYQLNHNLSTNQQGSSRSVANSESSLYDHLVYNEPLPADINRREVVEDWMCRGERGVVVGGSSIGGSGGGAGDSSKLLNQADTAGSSPEDAQNITHPLSNDTEYLTFETLVASAVREGVETLQGGVGEGEGGGLVSPHLLTSLHRSLVAQIETQAQSLRLPRSFLYSIDTELKSALQSFSGKPVSEASNDVPSVISQVLLTQYCSVLVQRLRDNTPALPHTPTKLLPQTKGRDISVESLASSMLEFRHEATTATQTDFSLATHHPHPTPPHPTLAHPTDPVQRSAHHSSPHPFSITAPSAPPPPHVSASLFHPSAGTQWQAPLSAPLPSPNDPSSSNGDPIAEGAGGGAGAGHIPSSFPGSQKPDPSWPGDRCGQGTESSTPTPAGADACLNGPGGAWGEAELEEGLIDELGEQSLSVHALAEADQSQDAVDAAEGDWEDSQAEGIQVADGSSSGGGCEGGGAAGISSPHQQPSVWLQSHDSSSQMEAEGQVECDADAAEGTSRGAAGGGHLGFGDLLLAQGGGSSGMREQELDEVPTKLQSPEGESLPLPPSTDHPQTSPPVSLGPPQPLHSPGSEG